MKNIILISLSLILMGCSSKRVFTDKQMRVCMADFSEVSYNYAKKMCKCVKKGYESAKNSESEIDITLACTEDLIINNFDKLFE